jgi:hypothetical protein
MDRSFRYGIFLFLFIASFKELREKLQLVESESAQLPGCGETAPIHADHDKICKFEKDEDVGYGEIVEAINKVMSPLGAWPSQVRNLYI